MSKTIHSQVILGPTCPRVSLNEKHISLTTHFPLLRNQNCQMPSLAPGCATARKRWGGRLWSTLDFYEICLFFLAMVSTISCGTSAIVFRSMALQKVPLYFCVIFYTQNCSQCSNYILHLQCLATELPHLNQLHRWKKEAQNPHTASEFGGWCYYAFYTFNGQRKRLQQTIIQSRNETSLWRSLSFSQLTIWAARWVQPCKSST